MIIQTENVIPRTVYGALKIQYPTIDIPNKTDETIIGIYIGILNWSTNNVDIIDATANTKKKRFNC